MCGTGTRRQQTQEAVNARETRQTNQAYTWPTGELANFRTGSQDKSESRSPISLVEPIKGDERPQRGENRPASEMLRHFGPSTHANLLLPKDA
jgi:hypothetical protein